MNYKTLTIAIHDLRKALHDQDWSAIENHGITLIHISYHVAFMLSWENTMFLVNFNVQLSS